MNKYLLTLFLAASAISSGFAQANISPAAAQVKPIYVFGGTFHIGNGKVIENGYMIIDKGKITAVGDATVVKLNMSNADVVEANGKHVYPGFIAPVTNLGLAEFEAVKASLDFSEIGSLNPHIRSIIAYNTDSKVPPTLRSNGILMAQVTPQGGLVSGSSSVVQLDAWNWEDASIKTDDAMHMTWPVAPKPRQGGRGPQISRELLKEQAQQNIDMLDQLFAEAKAYQETTPSVVNARLAAMKNLYNGSQKLFITVDGEKDIIAAVTFAKKYNITPVIVGAEEAYLITDFLKQNNISVVVRQPHALPNSVDDDVNKPYKNAALLSNAGINVVVSIEGYWQQRNLPFMAGTVAAWGLNPEQALQTITLNTAKALGLEQQIGSLETGKDATFFISSGDALDMKSNHVERAFIQGRDINLDNLHKQLDKKFSAKYGLKE